MRMFAAIAVAVALTGCVTTRSPSQAIHVSESTRPAADVRACIAKKFTPRYYGGVEVQGGWPAAPVGMKIEEAATGTRVETRGPMDRALASCL